jgi:hypothetical protein
MMKNVGKSFRFALGGSQSWLHRFGKRIALTGFDS